MAELKLLIGGGQTEMPPQPKRLVLLDLPALVGTSEVDALYLEALDSGDWILAHLYWSWLHWLDADEHRRLRRCVIATCGRVLPPDYVDGWCSRKCAEGYREVVNACLEAEAPSMPILHTTGGWFA